MAKINFNAGVVAPLGDRSALPEGDYHLIITGSDIKPGTNPATDTKADFNIKVLDGPLANSTTFLSVLIKHSNPVAAEIGQARLSSLCRACGIIQLTDTCELHGRPFRAKLTIREAADKKKYNDFDAFFTDAGEPVTATTGVTGGGAVAQPPAAAAPPPATLPPTTPAPLYFVAFNGTNLVTEPVNADTVRAMPQGLANLLVCQAGTQSWVAATSVIAAPAAPHAPVAPPAPVPPAGAPPAPAAGTTPPWLAGQNAPPTT